MLFPGGFECDSGQTNGLPVDNPGSSKDLAAKAQKWWKNACHAVESPPPPGDCGEDYYKHLRDKKGQTCDQPRKCSPMDSYAVIRDKMANGEGCVQARTDIMNQCFRGGDLAHQLERETVRGTMYICQVQAQLKDCN